MNKEEINVAEVEKKKTTAQSSNLTVDSLMSEASIQTGLDEWGDESFRIPLQVLLDSLKQEGQLHDQGWRNVHGTLLLRLKNRLKVLAEIKQHPGILNQSIRKPLLIVGLPRSGSTLLHRLLSLDQSNRPLLYWEALYPAPASKPEYRDTDPRIELTVEHIKKVAELWPNFRTIHDYGAKLPEECYHLLANTFTFPVFFAMASIPSYMEWLQKQDMLPVYRYYLLQLQILQSGYHSERWLLKCPFHMISIDSLLTVMPDASIIQTHRDPMEVIPSHCSLLTNTRRMNSDVVDPVLLGQECLNTWSAMLNNCCKARDGYDSKSFIDIYYKDLVKDPVGVVKKIYNHFNYTFNDDFETQINNYLVNNKKNKYGSHKYTLEQFELNYDKVKKEFENYYERFKI